MRSSRLASGLPREAIIVIVVLVVALAVGVLVGRWLLPNNGPCTVDYALVANCVVALGTIGLVIVGGFGIKYAYQTAKSAIDTLRLQSAPFILAEVDTSDREPDFIVAIRLHENKRLLNAPPDKESKSGVKISVRNLGARAVFDVQVMIRIEDINKHYEPTLQKIYAQWLLPGESRVYLIQNTVTTTVLQAAIESGTVGSEPRPGQSEDIHVYESGTFPFPIA
jgi:hypothetical protein